jgi:hypothetical protein
MGCAQSTTKNAPQLQAMDVLRIDSVLPSSRRYPTRPPQLVAHGSDASLRSGASRSGSRSGDTSAAVSSAASVDLRALRIRALADKTLSPCAALQVQRTATSVRSDLRALRIRARADETSSMCAASGTDSITAESHVLSVAPTAHVAARDERTGAGRRAEGQPAPVAGSAVFLHPRVPSITDGDRRGCSPPPIAAAVRESVHPITQFEVAATEVGAL